MSDFYTSKTVVAKKRHRCENCYGSINTGEEYMRIAGVFDGDFFSVRSHHKCEEIRDKAAHILGDDDAMVGILCEALRDGLREPAIRELAIEYNVQANASGGAVVDMEATHE